ncbi:hypothetical protein [Myxosarcina sp. GI1]|uniref:hypothetical protein n=1 Tax=Myxosarcina sp. GI1 TaxID=1541065 RepID=UPI00055FA107|nr:hypothetical protein [Myxosarcina sp. GI1]
MKNRTLSKKQNELRALIDERLKNEEPEIRQRVYQWLSNNQYFTDNELFDFYFCVAQNLAAVEVLGGSGEKILAAKQDLERASQEYTEKAIAISTQVTRQLEEQIHKIRGKQNNLEQMFDAVLEAMAKEHADLKAISTGLVNATATSLARQRQLLAETEAARKSAFYSVIISWIIPVITLLGWSLLLLLSDSF